MEAKETTRNVLVAVDIQNDFINGSLAVHEGEQVVQPTNEVAEAVRSTGGDVIFTRDWHPVSTPHFDKWPVHCVAETDGAVFHPDLKVIDGDVVLSKGMEQTDGYSGWDSISEHGETIETIVTPRPNERVNAFLSGLVIDYCVGTTALDMSRHFANDERVTIYLIRNAVRGIDQGDSEAALQAMHDAGIVAISSDEARAMIEETAK